MFWNEVKFAYSRFLNLAGVYQLGPRSDLQLWHALHLAAELATALAPKGGAKTVQMAPLAFMKTLGASINSRLRVGCSSSQLGSRLCCYKYIIKTLEYLCRTFFMRFTEMIAFCHVLCILLQNNCSNPCVCQCTWDPELDLFISIYSSIIF